MRIVNDVIDPEFIWKKLDSWQSFRAKFKSKRWSPWSSAFGTVVCFSEDFFVFCSHGGRAGGRAGHWTHELKKFLSRLMILKRAGIKKNCQRFTITEPIYKTIYLWVGGWVLVTSKTGWIYSNWCFNTLQPPNLMVCYWSWYNFSKQQRAETEPRAESHDTLLFCSPLGQC